VLPAISFAWLAVTYAACKGDVRAGRHLSKCSGVVPLAGINSVPIVRSGRHVAQFRNTGRSSKCRPTRTEFRFEESRSIFEHRFRSKHHIHHGLYGIIGVDVRWIRANAFMLVQTLLQHVNSVADTRSALLSKITSAKAICFAPRWLSSICNCTCLRVDDVTIASAGVLSGLHRRRRTFGIPGPGCMPVVSTRI